MTSTLTNYREVSRTASSDLDAGFQFEFTCGNCERTWKSPFRPYRKGQLAGLVHKVAYYLGYREGLALKLNVVAGAGEKRAARHALDEALALAEQRYTFCPGCQRVVCEECWDDRVRQCERCRGNAGRSSAAIANRRGVSEEVGGADEHRAGPKCSNCGAASDGGRFCAECGFDMASTHKSCPGCGALCTRGARFCTDCGHAF